MHDLLDKEHIYFLALERLHIKQINTKYSKDGMQVQPTEA